MSLLPAVGIGLRGTCAGFLPVGGCATGRECGKRNICRHIVFDEAVERSLLFGFVAGQQHGPEIVDESHEMTSFK